ncbi:BT4734/BF3469 family protein [Albibacterium bauzanense]|uniref:VirE-like protein n=1 Tax=Albibacterium bauzanense TaxID=653929 RepID=A0A4R1LVU6_9SPHI|nr:BT4734/BF3469 family protein [Albibacterium bauzanense]TCK82897.1 VirE-like protein [Albibacterium bauzanense]
MKSLKTSICSIFQNKYATAPKAITLWEALTTPWQSALIKQIQSLPYQSFEQHKLKGKLLAITPSSFQLGGRGEKHHVHHSGYLAFDIDGLKDKLDYAFNKIIQLPYISYCGKSASGKGLWGLMPIMDPSLHNEHFNAMVTYFNNLGITIDTAPRNVASYRFLAYDPHAYFNDNAQVFKETQTNEKIFVKPEINYIPIEVDQYNIWRLFNQHADFDVIHNILLEAGWKYHSTKAEKVRYTRPGKDPRNGLSAEYHTARKTFFVFSSEAPQAQFFINKGGGSPCDIVLQYAAHGDRKKARNIIKSHL